MNGATRGSAGPLPVSAASWIVRGIRRYPVVSFFAWFFTVGQVFAFAPIVLNADGGDWPTQPFIVASTIFGLLLPAVVITRVVDGPQGLAELWRRAVDVRVSLAWYAFALLAVPVLATVIAVAALGAPADVSVSALGSALVAGFGVALVLTFAPNNLWEEVAWAGFVQARLQARRGPVVAALITAPLFSLQHISLVAQGSVIEGAVVLVVLAVVAVPFRFLTGWVYNSTGSLFLVGLLHAAGNAVAGGSGFGAGFLARLYPGEQLVSMAHLLAFALLGLVVVVATRGRLGTPRTTSAASVTVTTAAPAPTR